MIQDTIIEGNRAIDLFMGNSTYPDERMYITVCRYHDLWDWLMPCVAKFNDMVKTEEIEHDMESSAIHDLMEHAILLVNITAAHNYFTQLVNWYTTTQSKEQVTQ